MKIDRRKLLCEEAARKNRAEKEYIEKLKERDRAKKAEVAEWGEEFDGALNEYRCPACKLHVDYHDNFCRECGQRIDWSEGES